MDLPKFSRGPPGSDPRLRGASGSGHWHVKRERNNTMSKTNENRKVGPVPDNSHDGNTRKIYTLPGPF